MRSISTFVVAALIAACHGQDPSDRPQNPDNWELTTINDGRITAHRKEKVLGDYFQWVIVDAEYVREWPNDQATNWWRNGVDLGLQSPSYPFEKAVSEIADTIDMSCSGTRTIRLRWKHPTAPPPSSVRIWLDATAEYEHSGLSGHGSCDDGLNDPTFLGYGAFGTVGRSRGRHYLELSVAPDGTAQMEVEQTASATQGGGVWESAAVWAMAGLIWGIDAMRLEITMNGQAVYAPNTTEHELYYNVPYTKRIEGHPLGWWPGYFHHLTKPHQYTRIDKRPARTTYFGSISNSAVWHIGVPEKKQVVKVLNSGTFYTPQVVPSHRFEFHGEVAPPPTGAYRGEWYEWDGLERAFSRNIDPIYKDVASPYLQEWKYGDLWDLIYKVLTIDKRPEETIENVLLTYNWGDGVQATSTRNVKFIHPVQDYYEFEEFTDHQADKPVRVLVVGAGRDESERDVVVTPPIINKEAVSSAVTFSTVILGVFGIEYPPAAAASKVGSVLGWVVENTPDGSEAFRLAKSGYRDAFVATQREGDAEPVPGQLPPLGDIGEYSWSVEARPKRLVKVVLYKVYGQFGFERQGVRLDTREQSLDAVPKLYTLRWTNTYGGSSGGYGSGSGGAGGVG